jgi:sugar/nucleoside kinase (ribokinase family)
MSDIDSFSALRGSLTDVRMTVPVSGIIARGRARQRRRMLRYAGGAAAIAAVAASVALGDTTAARPDRPTLTAFTVTAQADGSTTLTLLKGKQYRLDPGALRQALAEHHIPAVVRLNTTCDSQPSPQAGLDQVVSARRTTKSEVTLTINPSALAANEELSIGYYSSHTTWGLVYQGKPLHCHA